MGEYSTSDSGTSTLGVRGAAVVLPLLLAGCIHLGPALQDARILFQVRDGRSGSPLPDVEVMVRQDVVRVCQGVTDSGGFVKLDFRASYTQPTSMGITTGWVDVDLAKPGFETSRLALHPADFVLTSHLHLLTRGVTLRRTP